MVAYIILIVVVAVLLLGVGGTMLLRPRGMHGVRRSRARELDLTGSMPRVDDNTSAGGGTATATAPAPSAQRPEAERQEAPRQEAQARPSLEKPPPSAGRMVRLRARLARSQSGFGTALLSLLARDRLDDETWDEIEEVLITADVGVTPARQMTSDLRTRVKVEGTQTPDEVRAMLRSELLAQVETEASRALRTQRHEGRPAVVLMVGVNGTGKTTTCGKLARALVGDGETVVLGAADTFRAAAADQLQTWGERVGAQTVRSDKDQADPASVAFDAVSVGIEQEADVVLIDTAGRLHNKNDLMDELGKVKRVVEKRTAVDEVLLVLDATTGQNGLRQARVFAEVVDVTGIVLTKLDGTAKGGIVIAVQRELGVPVKLVGLGEGPDDLAPFDPVTFVDAILGG
jgi:fused signal recognition particle receptor